MLLDDIKITINLFAGDQVILHDNSIVWIKDTRSMNYYCGICNLS